MPSGASYPTIARALERKCSPGTFRETAIEDNRDYPRLLKHTMDYVNAGGINVVLTPGGTTPPISSIPILPSRWAFLW